jgi:hypothetical protein
MFRFTIRELVLLTIIVAMGVGWWIDRGIYLSQAGNLASDNVARSAEVAKQTARAEDAWRVLTETVNATTAKTDSN